MLIEALNVRTRDGIYRRYISKEWNGKQRAFHVRVSWRASIVISSRDMYRDTYLVSLHLHRRRR